MKQFLILILMFSPVMGWGQDDLYGGKEERKPKKQSEIFTSTYEANDSVNRWVYCEIVGAQKLLSSDVVVSIDYGQETNRWRGTDNRIRDEKGKVKNFNSMVDALNYMGTRGWEFVQAYTVSSGNSNVYHWLLRADLHNPIFLPAVKK